MTVNFLWSYKKCFNMLQCENEFTSFLNNKRCTFSICIQVFVKFVKHLFNTFELQITHGRYPLNLMDGETKSSGYLTWWTVGQSQVATKTWLTFRISFFNHCFDPFSSNDMGHKIPNSTQPSMLWYEHCGTIL